MQPDWTVKLHYAPDGGLILGTDGVSGGVEIPLVFDPAGLSDAIKALFPHLAGYAAFKIPAGRLTEVPQALKSQLAISAAGGDGAPVDATSLQIPGVLDDLYTYPGGLGVSFQSGIPTLRLWAPTARAVELHLFDDSNPATTATVHAMTLDAATGVWSITGDSSWNGRFYAYEVEVFVRSTNRVENNLVTDPYSVSLSRNSQRSQIVDLAAAAWKPAGWETLVKPRLDAPEDITLYELHVRDFSATDETVPPALRGTFDAFTLPTSDGLRHLSALALAGLTHVHLLPSFDFATVEEDKSLWQRPAGDLASVPPDSGQQQAAVTAVADVDPFNWGYDPWHYTVPEGSYATNADGPTRILEFRQMVQALNRHGLRVVMDVVYNHTTAAGESDKSVLDRVVPGYYHRLNLDGDVETSTCCPNTASEHNMMEKLLIDSALTWARFYKVDGFRFDLMGHHMKRNMLKLRASLGRSESRAGRRRRLEDLRLRRGLELWRGRQQRPRRQRNPAQHGGDRHRHVQRPDPRRGARRRAFLRLAGTGLPDRSLLRSQLDGPGVLGGPARAAPRRKWIGSAWGWPATSRVTGSSIGSGISSKPGRSTTTGNRPAIPPIRRRVINYVEAHDNETLFDAIELKAPASTPMADRVRVQNLGMSLLA